MPSYFGGSPCRTYPYCLRLAAWYEAIIIPAVAIVNEQKPVQRWLALPYYLYCLRLAALS